MKCTALLACGLLTGLSPIAATAFAQKAASAASAPRASNITALKSALSSRVGTVWIGEGQLPELGSYRSERQFIRVGPNEIAVLHKMTVGKMLLSYDSLSFIFNGNSVELSGSDMRGQALKAELNNDRDPLNFTFQRGEDWKSVYSDFRPDSFTLEVFTRRDGQWFSYLRTVHKRAR